MSVEFVDTNVLVYAHDGGAGAKHTQAVELLTRLLQEDAGALSTQVLSEFYSVATKKLAIPSAEAEEIIRDLGDWNIYRLRHADLLKAAQLQRKHMTSWWDALMIQSAIEMGCSVIWTEDLSDGRGYGSVTVRNPFRHLT